MFHHNSFFSVLQFSYPIMQIWKLRTFNLVYFENKLNLRMHSRFVYGFKFGWLTPVLKKGGYCTVCQNKKYQPFNYGKMSDFNPVFGGVRIARFLVLCVVACRFILCCSSFFDLRLQKIEIFSVHKSTVHPFKKKNQKYMYLKCSSSRT
jgi:hypothetical protein